MKQRHSTSDAGINIDASDTPQSMRHEATISDVRTNVLREEASPTQALTVGGKGKDGTLSVLTADGQAVFPTVHGSVGRNGALQHVAAPIGGGTVAGLVQLLDREGGQKVQAGIPSPFTTAFLYVQEPSGSFTLRHGPAGLEAGMTHVITGRFGTGTPFTDLLLYSTQTREAQFRAVQAAGQFSLVNSQAGWQAWDLIVPGRFQPAGPTDDLMFYRRPDASGAAGRGEFWRVEPGQVLTPIGTPGSDGDWGLWDLIVPGRFRTGSRFTDLLFYRRSRGSEPSLGQFWAVDGAGGWKLIGGSSGWGEWDAIVPGTFHSGSGLTDLFFYRGPRQVNGAGLGQFWAVDGAGGWVGQIGTDETDADGETVQAGRKAANGLTELVFYSPPPRAMTEVRKLSKAGTLSPTASFIPGPQSTMLVGTGNFDGRTGTDVFLYKTSQVFL